MLRKVQNTFDWECVVRVLAGATVAYVLGSVALNKGATHLVGTLIARSATN